jgi:hypothetical protein
VCYNCGKNGYFVTQCPYERKEEDDNKKKKEKSYKKDKKFFKKKSYGEAHTGQEWDSDDDSSKSLSDDIAIIAIKDKSSSSKSLFPNLSKHTCLMEREGKNKVNPKASSSPKYISSDEDTLSSNADESLPIEFCKNLNTMIKGLMK